MPALSESEGNWPPTAPLEVGERGVKKKRGILRVGKKYLT